MNEQQTILLVDDSVDNLFLLRESFNMAQCDYRFQEAHDGEEAIAYLKGEGIYSDRNKFPWPTVMLLDLNMPKVNGFEVLTWIRAQPVLKRLMVIVLTASMRPKDVEKAWELGASGFLVKPIELSKLADMMRCLNNWIQINEFPALAGT